VNNNAVEFGNYSIDFYSSGYTSLTIIEEINNSNVPFSEEYNISQTAINVNVYNRETGVLMNGFNVSLVLHWCTKRLPL